MSCAVLFKVITFGSYMHSNKTDSTQNFFRLSLLAHRFFRFSVHQHHPGSMLIMQILKDLDLTGLRNTLEIEIFFFEISILPVRTYQ